MPVTELVADVIPGSTGIAIEAAKLIGYDRVDAQSWGRPVRLYLGSWDEVDVLQELLAPHKVIVISGPPRPAASRGAAKVLT